MKVKVLAYTASKSICSLQRDDKVVRIAIALYVAVLVRTDRKRKICGAQKMIMT